MSFSKNFTTLGRYSKTKLLTNKYNGSNKVYNIQTVRQFGGILSVIGRLAKLRYLFLGSVIGGGAAIHNVNKFYDLFLILFKVYIYKILFRDMNTSVQHCQI
jgi:hypothetical protein